MHFDYRRRASYISGQSFLVGMAIWGLLFVGLFVMDFTTSPVPKSDPVIVSTYRFDGYDVAQESED